jgi:hypothetical protein
MGTAFPGDIKRIKAQFFSSNDQLVTHRIEHRHKRGRLEAGARSQCAHHVAQVVGSFHLIFGAV